MKKENFIRLSRSDRVFNIFNTALMVLIVICILYPLYFVLVASMSAPADVAGGGLMLWPKKWSLEGYKKIFTYEPIWRSYMNTIVYTVVGTLINLAITLPCAFALSQKKLVGRTSIMLLFSFTMFFSGGMVPTFLLIKNLNMIDSMWALILPGAASVWNIIVTRSFMQTSIPAELRDAASIDGANDFQYFFSIIIPCSKAIIAVMTLFYALGHWNNYFSALMYLNDEKLYPLQLVLRNLIVQNEINYQMVGTGMTAIADRAMIAEQLKYGVIIIASLPMMLLYPFVSKYLEEGIMIGSIKG
jgi:putative aldouronate transport system permease protein